LSSATQTEINLPYITADAAGPKHLALKLTRAKFEALVDDLIQKTVEPCRKALKDAGLTAGEIQRSRSRRRHDPHAEGPGDREEFFGKEPHKGVNPMRSSRSARRFRPACSRATSRTFSCST